MQKTDQLKYKIKQTYVIIRTTQMYQPLHYSYFNVVFSYRLLHASYMQNMNSLSQKMYEILSQFYRHVPQNRNPSGHTYT